MRRPGRSLDTACLWSEDGLFALNFFCRQAWGSSQQQFLLDHFRLREWRYFFCLIWICSQQREASSWRLASDSSLACLFFTLSICCCYSLLYILLILQANSWMSFVDAANPILYLNRRIQFITCFGDQSKVYYFGSLQQQCLFLQILLRQVRSLCCFSETKVLNSEVDLRSLESLSASSLRRAIQVMLRTDLACFFLGYSVYLQSLFLRIYFSFQISSAFFSTSPFSRRFYSANSFSPLRLISLRATSSFWSCLLRKSCFWKDCRECSSSLGSQYLRLLLNLFSLRLLQMDLLRIESQLQLESFFFRLRGVMFFRIFSFLFRASACSCSALSLRALQKSSSSSSMHVFERACRQALLITENQL